MSDDEKTFSKDKETLVEVAHLDRCMLFAGLCPKCGEGFLYGDTLEECQI